MATERQKKAAKIFAENGGKSLSGAMRAAGFSDDYAKNPQKLAKAKTWVQLLEEVLPDAKLTEVHQELLDAQRLDHMVFPVDFPEESIKELLNSVGCTPRKVQHSDHATHVWFWSPDNKARKDALELAYKLKGRIKNVMIGDPDSPAVQLVVIRPPKDKEQAKPAPGKGRTVKL